MEKSDYLVLDRAYYLRALARCEEQAMKAEEMADRAPNAMFRAAHLEFVAIWLTVAENRRMQAERGWTT